MSATPNAVFQSRLAMTFANLGLSESVSHSLYAIRELMGTAPRIAVCWAPFRDFTGAVFFGILALTNGLLSNIVLPVMISPS